MLKFSLRVRRKTGLSTNYIRVTKKLDYYGDKDSETRFRKLKHDMQRKES